MGLTVNSNISALNAQRHLGKITGKLGKSIERLSSGLRINKASDDAAGIAIASKLGSQVRGLNQAVRNANNAIALTQTAEGGINTVTNILQRVRELAVQAASDDNTSSDRANLALEAEGLVSELSRMVNTTEFNTSKLLDGSFSSKYFQVGANYSQKVTFTIGDVRGKSLGGRAETTGDIADGVTAALDENLGTGEVKINGYDVSATDSSDDQYSVLSIASAQITDTASTVISVAVSLAFTINGTTANIQLAGSTAYTGAEVAASIVAAINDADISLKQKMVKTS
jgi:flagellin